MIMYGLLIFNTASQLVMTLTESNKQLFDAHLVATLGWASALLYFHAYKKTKND